MKNMKKQLFTAVAMLLVATVALGTATYAWFVNNATGSVETMNFTASTSTSMQIGLGSGGTWTTGDGTLVPHGFTAPAADAWKGLITTKDIKALYGMTEDETFAALMPSSTVTKITANGFQTDKEWDLGTSKVATFAAITDFNPTNGDKKANSSVLAIPLYLRSSEDMPVYLNGGNATTQVAPLVTAVDPGIMGSVRVAFVVKDSADAVIFQQTASHAAIAYNTTSRSGITDNTGVWGIDKDGAVGGQNAVNWTDYTVKANAAGTFVDNTNLAGKTALLNLTKDEVTPVMVYVWLEGCDWDCVTGSANKPFEINLNLIGKEPVTP